MTLPHLQIKCNKNHELVTKHIEKNINWYQQNDILTMLTKHYLMGINIKP